MIIVNTSTAHAEVTTGEDDAEFLDFDMEDEPSSETHVTEAPMADIVVSDERIDTIIADTAIRTEIITEEQFQQKGAKTVGDALDEHLGIQVGTQFYENRGAPKGVQVQGCDPRRLLIMVNGQRVIGTADGIVDTSQLPLDNVERIEVIKGSSSALYGSDAICGVINIITKDAPKKGYQATAQGEYGRFNAYQGKVSISGRPHDLLGFQTGFDLRGRDTFDMDKQTIDTDGDKIRSYHGFAGLEYRPIPALGLKLDGEYLYETHTGIMSFYQDVLDKLYVYDTPLILHRPSGSFSARYNFNKSDWIRLRLYNNYFRSDSAEDLRNSPRYRTRITDNNYANASLDGQVLLGSWNLLSAGFEFSHEWMKVVKRQTDAFDGQTFETRDTLEVADETVYQFALFVQDEMTPTEWVTIIPGIRYTHNQRFSKYDTATNGFQNVTPKVSLMFEPLDWLTIRTSYGRGFRSPTLKDMFYIFDHSNLGYIVKGNPDLLPEKSNSINLGFEFIPYDGAIIQINGYYNQYYDLIATLSEPVEQNGSVATYSYGNINQARTYGFEFGVSFPIWKHFEVSAGYVLLYADNQDNNKTLPNRSRHQANGKFTFNQSQWGSKLTVSLNYNSQIYVDEDNTLTSPQYVTLNAYAEQYVYHGLRLYLRGSNITNTTRDATNPLDMRPQPGWEAFGGVIFDLEWGHSPANKNEKSTALFNKTLNASGNAGSEGSQ